MLTSGFKPSAETCISHLHISVINLVLLTTEP